MSDYQGFMSSIMSFAELLKDPDAQDLVGDWSTTFIVFVEDELSYLSIKMENGEINGFESVDGFKDGAIKVSGSSSDLAKMFSGEISPSEAIMNDRISVEAEALDQLKIDALSFILWPEA